MSIVLDNEAKYGAKNYAPLPVTIVRGQGGHLWDDNGKRYLDMLSAYSAVSHGHCHPKLLAALERQAQDLTVISRAFYNDKLAQWLAKICMMTGMDRALPLNTGVEAVEAAVKAARRWAYTVKNVPEEHAEIIICEGNFHGRTLAATAMSSEPLYREGFGPFPAGFTIIPYGDAKALQQAITANTAAFLVEPIQGEAGIRVPPQGYLAQCAKWCKEHNVLFMADEIQTGLGRTGALLACQHEHVKPDVLLLGKALGGGILPVSAFLARDEIMAVFRPGSHGSTFGGNPLAMAVSMVALELLTEEHLIDNSRQLGQFLLDSLRTIKHPSIKDIRGKGLFVAIEIDPHYGSARSFCLKLLEHGILAKDTHHTVVRLAPPLVVSEADLSDAVTVIRNIFQGMPHV